MNLDEFKALLKEAGESPEDIEGATVVEDSGWNNNYKDYDLRTEVVKVGDYYFSVSRTRSGSYYTDYDYGEPTVTEVVPKEVTTTIYITKE